MPHIHTGLRPRNNINKLQNKSTENSHALAVKYNRNVPHLYSQHKAPSVMHGSLLSKSTKCTYRLEEQIQRKKNSSMVFKTSQQRYHQLWAELWEFQTDKVTKVVKWRYTLIQFVSLCFACKVYIQSAKGLSSLCSSCVLITALSNVIILCIIKNNENINSACGYFTFHRQTQTEPLLVGLWCKIISAFHVLYKVRLDKDVNILNLSDIVLVFDKARQTTHVRSDHV